MSKKILSVVLVLVLLVATAAVSVSAAAGEYYEPKTYVPTADAVEVGQNRYFFLLPDDWKNEFTESAGVYWWDGTDPCGAADGSGGTIKWPGYKINQFSSEPVTQTYTDVDGTEKSFTGTVWYVDCPIDVTTIIFNNAYDGGDKSWDNFDEARFLQAYQTVDIGSEYYDYGESDNYPEGTESFNNMIYIIDPTQTVVNDLSGKSTFAGEWYYYHGGNKWDTAVDPVYGGVDGELPGEPEVPTEPGADVPATTAPATNADGSTKPAPQQGATSNVATPDQDSTVAGNGTIATDGFSMAMVMLVVAAAVVGVAVVVRKRQIEG